MLHLVEKRPNVEKNRVCFGPSENFEIFFLKNRKLHGIFHIFDLLETLAILMFTQGTTTGFIIGTQT